MTLWTSALDKGLGKLSGGASSLNSAIAGADSAGLIPPTMNALVSGAESLATGLKSAKSGSSELVSGVSSAVRGAEQLSTGANDAVSGAKELADGAKDAKDGAKELADGAKDAKDGAGELADGIHELKSNIGKLLDAAFDLDLTNLTSFVKRADNVRIAGAAGDVIMNKYGGLAACVILMALFAYVISVFVVHQINREQCNRCIVRSRRNKGCAYKALHNAPHDNSVYRRRTRLGDRLFPYVDTVTA